MEVRGRWEYVDLTYIDSSLPQCEVELDIHGLPRVGGLRRGSNSMYVQQPLTKLKGEMGHMISCDMPNIIRILTC